MEDYVVIKISVLFLGVIGHTLLLPNDCDDVETIAWLETYE